MKKKLILILAALLWSGLTFAQAIIRVKVMQTPSPLLISGSPLKLKGVEKWGLPPHEHLELEAVPQGITLNHRLFAELKYIQLQSPGHIRVARRFFDKKIAVWWLEGKEGKTPQLLVTHALPLETYVAGVVASEVSPTWPMEALKAQAIVSRTYAMYQKSRRQRGLFDLDSSVVDQVFKGAHVTYVTAQRAANATRGQILTYHKRPIEAYFHSTCGGETQSALKGWGHALAYLPGGTCAHCEHSEHREWDYTLHRKKLETLLRRLCSGAFKNIHLVKEVDSPRIKIIEIETEHKRCAVSADVFRRLLGGHHIRSTWLVDVVFSQAQVTFKGRGYGHGVGLCQWGAFGKAKQGQKAPQILEAYFPGTKIEKLY